MGKYWRCPTRVPVPATDLGSLLRLLLVLSLSSLLLVHFLRSLSKYRQGRVGVTSAEETAPEFELPAVMVCAGVGVGDFGPVGALGPWVPWVKYTNARSNANSSSSSSSHTNNV